MEYSAVIGILLMGFTVLVNAAKYLPNRPYKVYGNTWAFSNNWNDPQHLTKTTFLDGARPAMNVTVNSDSKTIISYPVIIRGWHYDMSPLQSDISLPKKVSTLSKILVNFSYAQGGSNMTGDFAYDIFLRKNPIPAKPECEVMVWGDHNSMPLGSPSGTNVITVGGRTYDLWEGFNGDAGYYVYTFVPHGTVASIGKRELVSKGSLNVDVKVFLNWVQQNKAKDGRYSDNLYLHAVEAGFEIVRGHGWVYVTASIDLV